MRRRDRTTNREILEIWGVGLAEYHAGLLNSADASTRARSARSGELTELERNLLHPYNQKRVPSWLIPGVVRFKKHFPSVNDVQAWQLNLLLQANHRGAGRRFNTNSERHAHLVHSMQHGSHVGVSSYPDSSIAVKYPERPFLFVELFSMLAQDEYFSRDLAPNELRGGTGVDSTDTIRAALLRYALIQENLTNGGAYLVDQDAQRERLYRPAGVQAHNFIVAHELAHKLFDEVDSAPELRVWVDNNSMSGANREFAADALAIELIQTVYESFDYPWDSVGAVLALKALQAFETGTHARLVAAKPTFEARLNALRSRFSRPAESMISPLRVDYLQHISSYEAGAITVPTWNLIRTLRKRRRIHAKGDVAQAIELASFGDALLARAHRDTEFGLLRTVVAEDPKFHLLGGCAEILGYDGSEDIRSYTTRFAERLQLSAEARESLEDHSQSIRYYDLIGWVLKSPLVPPRFGYENDDSYAIAILLAGGYSGVCSVAREVGSRE